jgi:hypothetical protein
MRIEFLGPINGANQTFVTTSIGLSTIQDFSVFYNGQMLDFNTDYTFTAPGTINLTGIIPVVPDKIWGLQYLVP